MSDIVSDMKTFTARALDRETARVLETCDAEGAVRIRHRNGRTYILSAQRDRPAGHERPNFQQRREAIFRKTLSPEATARLDRLVAGE
jgi:hypothetical protein